jgi:hypothetical protein
VASSDSKARSLTGSRNARRLVADAFEVGDGLADGDEQPQVARGRLAPGDDGRQVAIDLHFHLVDRLFLRQHVRRRIAAEVGQRVDRLGDLRLDQAAHFEHAGRNAAQLGIELRREMFVAHVRFPSVARLSRNGR